MDPNYKAGAPGDFAEYLQSTVKLDALERITQTLDNELADSRRVMKDIRLIFDSIPKNDMQQQPGNNNGLRHEDVSKFLDAEMPNLLLEDMTKSSIENLTMKGYAEDLIENYIASQPQNNAPMDMKSLDLEQYATSLEQLGKRLTNIKLNKRNDTDNRNTDLETKLKQLCEDVNMFTQMVQSKTALSECNKNWTPAQHNNKVLPYDNIINKLLSGINEVTYLLQNENYASIVRSLSFSSST